MKAIIAEIDKKHMIVITDKGDFIKVRRQMSAAIGDEIELKQRKTYPISKRLAGLAACFMACIFLSTGVYAYYTPYSYVSVDINPSLSLSLNRFERVISVNPLSEDAVDFIKDTKSLKNRDINAALSEIIKAASDKGYIGEETEDEIVVVVSAKNPEQEKKLEETVAKAAAKEMSKIDKSNRVTVENTNVENYKNALSNKVSPGREVLEGKLREVIPEIKDEDLKEMPVKEVINLINEKRKAEKEAEKAKKATEKAAEKADKNKDRDKDNDDNEERNRNGRDKDEKDNKEQDRTDRKNRDDDKGKNDIEGSDRNNNNNKGIGNRNDREDDDSHEDEDREENKKKDKDEKDKDDKNNKNNKKNDTNDKNNKNDMNDKGKNNDDPERRVNNNRNDGRSRSVR